MLRRPHRRWRWRNVPIPEAHVAGLLAGTAFHLLVPRRLTRHRRLARAAGGTLLVAGASLAAWAVRSAGEVNTANPSDLVTVGPYAVSRNPMYVGWTLLYAGASLLANAAWPLALLPAVATWTHEVVRAEERALENALGAEYREYVDEVRRYV